MIQSYSLLQVLDAIKIENHNKIILQNNHSIFQFIHYLIQLQQIFV